MVIYFSNKEEDYLEWCKTNLNGYVFNHAGGATGNVVHRVDCRHLNVPSRAGSYTTRYPKYCSTDKMMIIEKADILSKPYGWRECKDCLKSSS